MAELKTATDELRHLLEKKCIEWKEPNNATRYFKTTWRVGPWEYEAIETSGSQFSVYAEHHYWLTPEQAIEATLGRGTCRNISDPPSGFLCSECRWGDFAEPSHLLTTAKFTDNDGGPNYCPNCGRKVVK